MRGVRVDRESPFTFSKSRTRAGESVILPQAVKEHTCLLCGRPRCRDQLQEIRALVYPRQRFGLLFRVRAGTGEGQQMGRSGDEADL